MRSFWAIQHENLSRNVKFSNFPTSILTPSIGGQMTSDFKFVLFLTRCWKRIIKVLWSNLRIFVRNPSRLLKLRALLVSRRMFRISGTCTVKRSRTLIANFIKKIKIFFFFRLVTSFTETIFALKVIYSCLRIVCYFWPLTENFFFVLFI